MYIRKGDTRTVLLLPMLGVAVKFARIKIIDVRNILWRNRGDWHFIRNFITAAPDDWYTLRWHLFGGIQANLSEAHFWRETRNAFVWPTLLSCGLFTIQRFGAPTGMTDGELSKKFVELAGTDVYDDFHCFGNRHNFCADKHGRIYILDYASSATQKILRKYEKELRANL